LKGNHSIKQNEVGIGNCGWGKCFNLYEFKRDDWLEADEPAVVAICIQMRNESIHPFSSVRFRLRFQDKSAIFVSRRSAELDFKNTRLVMLREGNNFYGSVFQKERV
jgi:hypothetical protein